MYAQLPEDIRLRDSERRQIEEERRARYEWREEQQPAGALANVSGKHAWGTVFVDNEIGVMRQRGWLECWRFYRPTAASLRRFLLLIVKEKME